jgi:hypothetical protein
MIYFWKTLFFFQNLGYIEYLSAKEHQSVVALSPLFRIFRIKLYNEQQNNIKEQKYKYKYKV